MASPPHPRDPSEYPSAESLRSAFEYEPEEGIIKWKRRADCDLSWNARQAGKDAGCITANGYKQIRFNGRGLRYHRVAWILVYGECPTDRFIDHIDGDGLNNKLNNLRLATRGQNQRNAKRYSSLGLPRGVSRCLKNGRLRGYKAAIRIGSNRRLYLGPFPTIEAASSAYARAAEKFHGEFSGLHRDRR